MSFEFFAPLPSGIQCDLGRLGTSLCSKLPIALVSQEPEQISFRWRTPESAQRESEDFAVWIRQDVIWLTIHVGTGSQRDQLVSLLAQALSESAGGSFSFQEE